MSAVEKRAELAAAVTALQAQVAEMKREGESNRALGARVIRAEQRRAELEAVLGTHRKDDQAEIERLRAEVDELKAQRERRRVRLVALDNDALSMRGALSPMGEARKVPMPLGETLLPAVEWLIGRVAELEAERGRYVGKEPTVAEEMAYLSRCLYAVYDLCDDAERKGITSGGMFTVEAVRQAADGDRPAAERPALPWAHAMPDGDLHGFLDDLVSAAMGRWRSEPEVPDRTVLADIEKACADWRTPGQGYRSDEPVLSEEPAQVSPEDPHDSPLHHRYETGRDLPEGGDGRG